MVPQQSWDARGIPGRSIDRRHVGDAKGQGFEVHLEQRSPEGSRWRLCYT